MKPAVKSRFCFLRKGHQKCLGEGRSDMKMLLSFFIGTTVGLLAVLLIFHNAAPVAADSGSVTTSNGNPTTTITTDSSTSTLPNGTDVNSLMPDVKKIYDNALGAPYRQVESEITDPDIANYFRRLMNETGLDKVGLDH